MSFAALPAVIVLLSISVASLLLFLYPYFIYPRVLRRLPPVESAKNVLAEGSSSSGSQFALLFCAYNEAGSAMEKAANLTELIGRYPELVVFVYDDGSTDGCGDIYASVGANVRVVRGPGRTGKAHGMKRLVMETNRPFLIFTDANVLIDDGVPDALLKHYADERVGGVCGHLVYEGAEGTATQAAGGRYWSIDEELKRLESRTGSVMGGDGSIFSVRRILYPDFPDTVQDDFTVTMSVVFGGYRLIYAEDVVARERLVAKSAEEYRRKVRIAARAFHTHMVMRPRLHAMTAVDRWKYASHKVLRWWGGAFVLVSAVAGLLAVAFLNPLVALAAILLAAFSLTVGARRIHALATLREVLLALTSTMHGLFLGARGRTFATWTPPKSR